MQKNKQVPIYKDATFMNILRRRIFSNYPMSRFTYGSETTPKRKELELEKTHANDAIGLVEFQQPKGIHLLCFKLFNSERKNGVCMKPLPVRAGKNLID